MGPLVHSKETMPGGRGALPAWSGVFDDDLHLVATPPDGDVGVASIRVANDIRQRLLHDSVHRQVQTGRQPHRCGLEFEADFQARSLQPLQKCLHILQARLRFERPVGAGLAKNCHHPLHLCQRLPPGVFNRLKRLGRMFRAAVHDVPARRSLDGHHSDAVRDHIVELSCDPQLLSRNRCFCVRLEAVGALLPVADDQSEGEGYRQQHTGEKSVVDSSSCHQQEQRCGGGACGQVTLGSVDGHRVNGDADRQDRGYRVRGRAPCQNLQLDPAKDDERDRNRKAAAHDQGQRDDGRSHQVGRPCRGRDRSEPSFEGDQHQRDDAQRAIGHQRVGAQLAEHAWNLDLRSIRGISQRSNADAQTFDQRTMLRGLPAPTLNRMNKAQASPTRLRIAAGIFLLAGAVNFSGIFIGAPVMTGSGSQALPEAAAKLTALRISSEHDFAFAVAICLVCLVAVTLPAGRGAVLTFVGAAIALLANLFHAAVVAIQLIQADMAQAGLDPAQMAALYDRIDNDQWIGATFVPLIFLFPLGMILLTLGLWRSRLVPVWAVAPAVLATLVEIAHVPASEQLIAVLAPIASLIIAVSLVMRSRRPAGGVEEMRSGMSTIEAV